jgi:hypothetical protein
MYPECLEYATADMHQQWTEKGRECATLVLAWLSHYGVDVNAIAVEAEKEMSRSDIDWKALTDE